MFYLFNKSVLIDIDKIITVSGATVQWEYQMHVSLNRERHAFLYATSKVLYDGGVEGELTIKRTLLFPVGLRVPRNGFSLDSFINSDSKVSLEHKQIFEEIGEEFNELFNALLTRGEK